MARTRLYTWNTVDGDWGEATAEGVAEVFLLKGLTKRVALGRFKDRDNTNEGVVFFVVKGREVPLTWAEEKWITDALGAFPFLPLRPGTPAYELVHEALSGFEEAARDDGPEGSKLRAQADTARGLILGMISLKKK